VTNRVHWKSKVRNTNKKQLGNKNVRMSRGADIIKSRGDFNLVPQVGQRGRGEYDYITNVPGGHKKKK